MIYSEGISVRHEDPSSHTDALKDFVHATEERAISIEIVDVVTSIDSASSLNMKQFFPFSGRSLEEYEKVFFQIGEKESRPPVPNSIEYSIKLTTEAWIGINLKLPMFYWLCGNILVSYTKCYKFK